MAKLTTTEQERPSEGSVRTSRRTLTFGTLAMVGGAALTVGAILVDLGAFTERLFLMSLGNALSAGAGLALIFVPVGLLVSGVGGSGTLTNAGAVCLVLGICLASLVDVPAISDPTNIEAGGALGPVGLLLVSAGFLAWFVAI